MSSPQESGHSSASGRVPVPGKPVEVGAGAAAGGGPGGEGGEGGAGSGVRVEASPGPMVDVMNGASRWTIKCLDHGFVALVDAMPRLVPAGQTADSAIVQAARVSYGAGTKRVNEDRGLIRYLLRHRHTTPFEMVEFKFHVSMPIFIARQWIRHRTANVNEYSGRYSLMPERFYRPTLDNVRKQSTGNRQGGEERFRTLFDAGSAGAAGAAGAADEAEAAALRDEDATARQFEAFIEKAASLHAEYEALAKRGVARELARIGLPLSLYTEWYWKCDLHNILRFLSLRMDAHAQEEIRVYARAMHDLIAGIVPVTMEAWRDYELEGLHLTRLEIEAIRASAAAAAAAGGRATGAAGAAVPLASDNRREQEEWDAKRARLGL